MQAVHIMELALHRYGSYEKFEQVTGGSLLTKSRIWHNVKKYMEKEGCIGEVSPDNTGGFHYEGDPLLSMLFSPVWFKQNI